MQKLFSEPGENNGTGTCPNCGSDKVRRTCTCYVCGEPSDDSDMYDLCRIEVKSKFAAWMADECKNTGVRTYEFAECVSEFINKDIFEWGGV